MVAREEDQLCTHPNSALKVSSPSPTGPQFYICEACGESLTPELLHAARELEERDSMLNPVDHPLSG